jgi:hypothetical protein
LIFRVPNTDGPSSLRFAAPPIGEPYKLSATRAFIRRARPAQGDWPPLRADRQIFSPLPGRAVNAFRGNRRHSDPCDGDHRYGQYRRDRDFDSRDLDPCAPGARKL